MRWGLRTKEEAVECKAQGWFSATPQITEDNTSFLYKKDKQDKHPQIFTWYSLRAQLSLEGYADAVLNVYHTTAKEPPSSVSAHQAQRYNVEPVSVKPWCCAYKKRNAE